MEDGQAPSSPLHRHPESKVVMDNQKVTKAEPYEKIAGQDREKQEFLKKHRIDG